ncbi:MAG: M15 family metallopeptidase [Fermentimonas caenicola]|mgnify:FL=1|jgi:hypothetical protein|uniref:M15 family metallopeptidase n=1 Tax=Lascolabacillus sp. TaxID=1924068 RepID=UPI0012174564|nr:M15 family metallopeptidase [Lascolabacillus sp.]MDD2606408.1 M15 family metallopeptidase [Lascolabacillus sp.]MDI9625611.1 M15 family metallopeptidase [Bacteroidota bacterium]TAH62316.1 MAG: M15 family peptidase [Fermentimonas caenicola]
MRLQNLFFLIFLIILSCNNNRRDSATPADIHADSTAEDLQNIIQEPVLPDTIIDASYTFDEAVEYSEAPEEIISQLELVDVYYISTDGKIHKGQVVTNRQIANDIKEIFSFMLDEGFVIEKAIPIVKYGWNDSLSMADNNSYSFCYRNISYSKHATGMAIDINPRFNPLRWKNIDRPNTPAGAVLDTTVNGTLYPGHIVVNEFRRLGFRWGHTFTKYYDDHHFEKR